MSKCLASATEYYVGFDREIPNHAGHHSSFGSIYVGAASVYPKPFLCGHIYFDPWGQRMKYEMMHTQNGRIRGVKYKIVYLFDFTDYVNRLRAPTRATTGILKLVSL